MATPENDDLVPDPQNTTGTQTTETVPATEGQVVSGSGTGSATTGSSSSTTPRVVLPANNVTGDDEDDSLPALAKRLFVPVPDKFAGKSSDNIRDWFETYELYTYGNLYDDHSRARFLGAFLTGDPANVWKTKCSKKDYDADKAILIKTFEKCRLPDEAWARFDNYQWDRIQPLSVYSAALSRYLNEYNDLLKPENRLTLAARETLLVEKLSKLATGAAKAEIRRARPQTSTDVCDLLGAYVDNGDQPGVQVVRSMEPKLDASIEMLTKLLGAFEGAQARQ
ncbi:hypothetical protein FOL47_004050, partial [Perkinsus chesapeaki]